MQVTVAVLAVGAALGAVAQQGVPSLLPNPSFELVEPPRPTAQDVARGQPPPADQWLPRTWNLWAAGGAAISCPDDPAQAHTGRRCVKMDAQVGQAFLRYGPMPVPDGTPWAIRLWARGRGKLHIGAVDATGDPWQSAPVTTHALQETWTEIVCEFRPPESCRKWLLHLESQGPTECWLDDVSTGYPGLTPLSLPPTAPLRADEHTRLYLPFEEPLDEYAYFVKGQVSLVDSDLPGFGKALHLGPEGYVACSADEHLLPSQGTIEVWCKLLEPGNDGIAHPIVSIPGPEGMWLGKDQYSHVGLQFSSGWAPLSNAIALGYAWSWQPCWRHLAACWDQELMQVFVDGKLIAWKVQPRLSRVLGPELGLGSAGMELDDLRISDVVRYRIPVPPNSP